MDEVARQVPIVDEAGAVRDLGDRQAGHRQQTGRGPQSGEQPIPAGGHSDLIAEPPPPRFIRDLDHRGDVRQIVVATLGRQQAHRRREPPAGAIRRRLRRQRAGQNGQQFDGLSVLLAGRRRRWRKP